MVSSNPVDLPLSLTENYRFPFSLTQEIVHYFLNLPFFVLLVRIKTTVLDSFRSVHALILNHVDVFYWLRQVHAWDLPYPLWYCGWEHEPLHSLFPGWWDELENSLYFLLEPNIQHLIRLVQTYYFDKVQLYGASSHKIQHPAWSTDNNVDSLLKNCQLLLDACTPIDRAHNEVILIV